jgi:hypothetical protein
MLPRPAHAGSASRQDGRSKAANITRVRIRLVPRGPEDLEVTHIIVLRPAARCLAYRTSSPNLIRTPRPARRAGDYFGSLVAIGLQSAAPCSQGSVSRPG